MITTAGEAKNPNMRRKRQKNRPKNAVARWRSQSDGTVVVLTASGGLWQREKTAWRQRAGAWTAKRVEDWAAATGFVRVSAGVVAHGAEPAWSTEISTLGLRRPVRHGHPPPSEKRAGERKLIVGDFLADREATIARYAERAANRLPLFGG